jgi:hypothetical protein
MLRMKLSIEIIQKVSGLSLSEIEIIKDSLSAKE